MQDFKKLCEQVGKLRAIIFFILNTLVIFVTIIVLISLFSKDDDVARVGCWIFISIAAIWVIYFYYLYFVLYEREQLRQWEEETITEEERQKSFLDTAKDLLKHYLIIAERSEKKLDALKEKVKHTSSPFLIRKYLKKKLAYETAIFQIKCFSTFLNTYEVANYNLDYLKINHCEEN